LLSTQQEDGAFYDPKSRAPTKNYCTALAVLALASSEDRMFDEAVLKGRDYLVEIQADEGEGYEKDKDYFYGGIGYGGDLRPDLSNLNIALDALKAAGLPDDHPAYQKALVFLARCQDNEGNDQAWAKASGGFAYSPDLPTNQRLPNTKEAEREIVPYGSMTFAGLKSLIFCSVSKEDPRVQEALQWISRSYSVQEHPGMGQVSIFYYYYMMARSLEVLDQKTLTLADGRTISWAEDLAKELLKRQHDDGHWVNPQPKYMEGNAVLVTAYALNALNIIYRLNT
jgi:squalene-hopene/tetraprenyl-beta-curcumene cyclase